MTTRLDDLESEVMQLPVDDRAHLAERLVASLDGNDEILAEWIAEAEQRLAEYDRGEVAAAPIEQVLARARARLAERDAST